MTYQPPPGYPMAASVAADPTAVIGRRFVAWLIDVMAFFAIALAVAFPLWFNNADRYNDVGSDFCNAVTHMGDFTGDYSYDDLFDADINGQRARDLVVERNNDTCVLINDDAWVAEDSDTALAVGVGLAIAVGIPLINYTFLQGATGASLGKRMLGLRVVKADGQVAPFGSNLLRTILLIVDMAPICFPFGALVGGITALASKGHRRVGDMAAGTFVVGKDSVGTPITVLQAGPVPWTAPTPGGVYAPPGVQATPVTPGIPPVPPSAPPSAPPAAPMAPPTAPPVAPSAPPAAPEASAPQDIPPPPPGFAEPEAAADERPNAANAQWDDRWGAWMRKHPTGGEWQRWDDASETWLDI